MLSHLAPPLFLCRWVVALLGLAALVLTGLGSALAAETLNSDTMAARVMACTSCHGKEGRATPDGYFPRLAGKPQGYLYNQLLNFKEGRRRYPQMAALLENLSDAYLMEIAAHFSSLDLPYPPPRPPQATAAELEMGRRLALKGDSARGLPACVQCHGAALTGLAPAIPGLLGLPRDYLNSQLGAWQTGQRMAKSPDCMHDVASKLRPEEVSAVSVWLATQTPPVDSHPARSLPKDMPLVCGGLQIGVAP
jgi:cytochrome c553